MWSNIEYRLIEVQLLIFSLLIFIFTMLPTIANVMTQNFYIKIFLARNGTSIYRSPL